MADLNDDDLLMGQGLTMCAAVASLQNGWGARRPSWPEWQYVEALPDNGTTPLHSRLIIWDEPVLVARDNNGKEYWDHNYSYWNQCAIEDAIENDWCVYKLSFLNNFVLKKED